MTAHHREGRLARGGLALAALERSPEFSAVWNLDAWPPGLSLIFGGLLVREMAYRI